MRSLLFDLILAPVFDRRGSVKSQICRQLIWGAHRTVRAFDGCSTASKGAAAPRSGSHSFVGFATREVCDKGTKPATIYRQLSVGIANGETVHAGAGVRITEVCGLYLSSFGVPARYTPLAPAPGTPATATVRVQMPASVRAGTVLHYTITLSNPTKTSITLRPCPGYSEGVYASGLVVRRSFALNC